jgi:hypothetical protein
MSLFSNIGSYIIVGFCLLWLFRMTNCFFGIPHFCSALLYYLLLDSCVHRYAEARCVA